MTGMAGELQEVEVLNISPYLNENGASMYRADYSFKLEWSKKDKSLIDSIAEKVKNKGDNGETEINNMSFGRMRIVYRLCLDNQDKSLQRCMEIKGYIYKKIERIEQTIPSDENISVLSTLSANDEANVEKPQSQGDIVDSFLTEVEGIDKVNIEQQPSEGTVIESISNEVEGMGGLKENKYNENSYMIILKDATWFRFSEEEIIEKINNFIKKGLFVACVKNHKVIYIEDITRDGFGNAMEDKKKEELKDKISFLELIKSKLEKKNKKTIRYVAPEV